MPVYEYECEKCGHRFEVRQGINDPPRQRCPECRGRVRKLFSNVGIAFKGGGFYCNDSRAKSACKSCDPAAPASEKPCGEKKAVTCPSKGACAD